MTMAKVHPRALVSSSSSSAMSVARREVYTIWMKSLVLNGNGCTVYNSDGQIVYRVDNYDCKCSDEVYLMDLSGKALFKILRKKLRVFGRWEGYRCDRPVGGKQKPFFRVQKPFRILKRDPNCGTSITVGFGGDNSSYYKIEGMRAKSYYRIMDMSGGLVAEVKPKQTSTGIALGEDVLTLVVEPNMDHLLVMGLMVVCGLINHRM